MFLALNRPLSNPTPLRLIAIALTAMMALSIPGCIQRIWERDDTALVRIVKAPPIAVESGEDRHLVVMQAPSPGWSIRLDATELTPDGKRVFVTIRKPDPAYQYTQQIVLMRVLTSVRLDSNIEVVGRLLEFNEKTKGRGYAPVPVVESFE
tara:strand:+ start:178275 stop:178727 length:453 start_codon:yes stop_codon:yes gene_type:complete